MVELPCWEGFGVAPSAELAVGPGLALPWQVSCSHQGSLALLPVPCLLLACSKQLRSRALQQACGTRGCSSSAVSLSLPQPLLRRPLRGSSRCW